MKADVPIVGDVKNVLQEMIGIWRKRNHALNEAHLDKWWHTLEAWRSRDCLRIPDAED